MVGKLHPQTAREAARAKLGRANGTLQTYLVFREFLPFQKAAADPWILWKHERSSAFPPWQRKTQEPHNSRSTGCCIVLVSKRTGKEASYWCYWLLSGKINGHTQRSLCCHKHHERTPISTGQVIWDNFDTIKKTSRYTAPVWMCAYACL